MLESIRWGPDNPHPFSQMRTELIWEGKYDEYGNRRLVDIAGCAMPMQRIGASLSKILVNFISESGIQIPKIQGSCSLKSDNHISFESL
ncbi:MAG: hypothetical protein ACP5OM_08025 [Methanothrix sp.]